MKLAKAIEILAESVELTDFSPDPDFIESIKLGIEALKRCQLARKETSFVGPALLPGETEE